MFWDLEIKIQSTGLVQNIEKSNTYKVQNYRHISQLLAQWPDTVIISSTHLSNKLVINEYKSLLYLTIFK